MASDWVVVSSGYSCHENLSELSQCGFYDLNKNKVALEESRGDVKAAIKLLLSAERKVAAHQSVAPVAPLRATQLQCEWQDAPLGVPPEAPMLSWQRRR